MGPKYEHFKFQLDDLVQLKVNAGESDRKMQIVERVYHECPGGVQLFYVCVQSNHINQKWLENTIEPHAATKAETAEADWAAERVKSMLERATKPPVNP